MWLVPGQLANRHGNISFGNPMLRVKSKYDDQTKKKAWVVSGLMEKDQLKRHQFYFDSTEAGFS